MDAHHVEVDHLGQPRLGGRETIAWYSFAFASYVLAGICWKWLLTWLIGPMWLVATVWFGPYASKDWAGARNAALEPVPATAWTAAAPGCQSIRNDRFIKL